MLPSAYNAKDYEDAIYAAWIKSGAFKAKKNSKKPAFTISMPPPNATGVLHLGHAVMLALEDILTRYHRMRGFEALWLPGTDHAAIATESVVIRKLKEELKIPDPRKTLGREKVLQKIAEFVTESQKTIRGQVSKMGASCDWSRQRYTMDAALNRCVNEVFKKMHDDGLIYRGHRIVNWDPRLQTTISDDEMNYVQEKAPFYTFRYGPFEISTSRPETKFGDKYVVMHPQDARYKEYEHGQTFECEWINGPVRATIIKDPAVDPNFGTGVMTITPWHDKADFEIAERHGLEKQQIIDFYGKLLPVAGEFAGMSIEEARPKIVEKLKSKGLLVKTDENYLHNKAVSSRGGGTIEPQIKLQWFVDVNRPVVPWKGKTMSLKEVMHDAVHSGDIKIVPEHFSKTYFNWIDNLNDWCISRQIWWGHRVPVWYCVGEDHCTPQCKEPMVSVFEPKACPHCGSAKITQDPDTLDTWFSSGLWTWSTLVDPKAAKNKTLTLAEILKKSPDFHQFHPTSVLETGYDILFFWVARMILMTTYAVGQIPFRTVYLHGLIRTREGKKMSKSDPKTCIDPLDMIGKYGADALRLSMVIGNSPGSDMRLYEEKIQGYRNFTNKLWNASRYVLGVLEEKKVTKIPAKAPKSKSPYDEWILNKLARVTSDVNTHLAAFRISDAGQALYSFLWDDFCDWYLELSKGEKQNPAVLGFVLKELLSLLHPFIPFVTEAVYKELPGTKKQLLVEKYPQSKASEKAAKGADTTELLIGLVQATRKLRAENKIEPALKISAVVYGHGKEKDIEKSREELMRLARLEKLEVKKEGQKIPNAAGDVVQGVEVFLPLQIDPAKEKERLLKELDQLQSYIEGMERKLGNDAFVKNAPPAVVEADRARLKEAKEKHSKLAARRAGL